LYAPDDVQRVREYFGRHDHCERHTTSSPTRTATSA
jgi:hypothetical protein